MKKETTKTPEEIKKQIKEYNDIKKYFENQKRKQRGYE